MELNPRPVSAEHQILCSSAVFYPEEITTTGSQSRPHSRSGQCRDRGPCPQGPGSLLILRLLRPQGGGQGDSLAFFLVRGRPACASEPSVYSVVQAVEVRLLWVLPRERVEKPLLPGRPPPPHAEGFTLPREALHLLPGSQADSLGVKAGFPS